MIGKFVIFVAVAVSSAVALPIGNCAPWDAAGLGNLISGSANIIPQGLNFPPPTSALFETPAFPGNLMAPGVSANVPMPPLPPLPSFPSISAPTVQSLPALPAPALPPPVVQLQRIQPQTIQIPNLPNFQTNIIPSPVCSNIEARFPAIHTRLQALPSRIPGFEAGLPPFPSVQPQIFAGPSVAQNPFGQC